jgi:DNA-binding NarL/FixJ family response regulator
MTTQQAKTLIESDPDFVYAKRFNYSIEEVLKRHPDGCQNRMIASILMVTEDDVDEWYRRIVEKLRDAMGVDSL